jgi:Protease inhibitor Inh
MRTSRSTFRTAALLMIAMTAAGCTGNRFADWEWPGAPKEKPPVQIVNMSGRWMLTSPNRGQCGMNFSGAAKATEGAIAPEGGCPGNFFTSRKWALEDGNVIIRDHNGEQLAQLTPTGTGMWFEGQATTGERIMLAR